jgi:hypothetical protein
MTKPSRLVLLALGMVSMLGSTPPAHGQYPRAWRGPGIVLRVPYVGTIRLGAPPVVRGLMAAPGPAWGYGPGVVAPPLYAAPRYVPGATRVVLDDGPPPAPELSEPAFAAPDELAAMDDGSLLNAVLQAMAQLDADVAQFNTGATWQAYFRLPDDALPPPSPEGRVPLGFKSIEATLKKFDAIALSPDYPMIAGQSSFIAAHHALAEVVNRFGPAAAKAEADANTAANEPRTVAEELPAPATAPILAAPNNATDGEHSVLTR